MYKIALIVLALVAGSSARLRECDRGVPGPFPSGVRITGCPDNNAVCNLVRGRDVVGEIDFVSVTSATTLRPEVTAYAFSVRAVYELPEDRQIGCDWIHGTRCPLDQGEFATYEINMPVTEEYPLTPLDLELRLFDQNNVNQFCFILEAEVVVG